MRNRIIVALIFAVFALSWISPGNVAYASGIPTSSQNPLAQSSHNVSFLPPQPSTSHSIVNRTTGRSIDSGSTDPQAPCTSQSSWSEPSQAPDCGNYIQSAAAYFTTSNLPSGCNAPACTYASSVQVSVNFASSNPGSLQSNKWISGGISTYGPINQNGNGYDIGYEIYAYVDNTGTLGVATYIMGACEFHSYSQCPNNFEVFDSYSAPLSIALCNGNYCGSGNYKTDTIDLQFYWCTSYACQQYWGAFCQSNTLDGVFISNVKDLKVNPDWWTYRDSCPTKYVTSNTPFYFGLYSVYGPLGQCCNPSFYWAIGYQMAYSSDQLNLPTSAVIELLNAQYDSTPVPHAETISGFHPSEPGWWHDNWWWGGFGIKDQDTGGYNDMQVVEVTSVEYLLASQANQQTFTAEGSGMSSPECVTVTNFAALQSDAESAGEGYAPLGGFIWGHPWANGLWWNVLYQGSCPSATWTYDTSTPGMYDGTQLW